MFLIKVCKQIKIIKYTIIQCNFIEMNQLVHESDIAFVSQVSFSNSMIYYETQWSKKYDIVLWNVVEC